MNKLFGLFLLALAFLAPSAANAVTCFWVGGTATWDSTNTGGGGTGGIKWASASGGGTTCAGGGTGGSPSTGDAATFDGSSGGGTVTVNTTVAIQAIDMSAFTGTLDFATNNNNVTLSGNNAFASTGAGTRTLNMGNGTWTLSGSAANWNISGASNFTFNANSSTIAFTGTGARQFQAGSSRTYSTVTVAGGASSFISLSPGNDSTTVATLTISTPNEVQISQPRILNVTNLTNITATSTQQVLFVSGNLLFGQAGISSANNFTCTWCAFAGMAFSGGGTFTGSNSFNLGQNSGITITAPSSGAGGPPRFIGG